MEELIRLVEAVKLVDAKAASTDGRIWAQDRGIDIGRVQAPEPVENDRSSSLLKHASKSVDGYYMVESTHRVDGGKSS